MTDQELFERILLNARIVDEDMTSEWTQIPNRLIESSSQLASDVLEWVRRRPELAYQDRIAELEAEIERLKSKPQEGSDPC